MFGGFTMERTLRVICDEPDDPNLLRFCDDADNDIPCVQQFKFAGTYPVGWGIQVSGVVPEPRRPRARRLPDSRTGVRQQDPGPGLRRRRQPGGHPWLITRDDAYAANCTGAVPSGRTGRPGHDRGAADRAARGAGQEFLPRINQLDLSLAKWFGLGASRRLQLQLDIFNMFNANPVLGVRSVNFARRPTTRSTAS